MLHNIIVDQSDIILKNIRTEGPLNSTLKNTRAIEHHSTMKKKMKTTGHNIIKMRNTAAGHSILTIQNKIEIMNSFMTVVVMSRTARYSIIKMNETGGRSITMVKYMKISSIIIVGMRSWPQ